MSCKIQIRIIVAMSVITLSIQKSVSVSSGKACTLEEMRSLAANACFHMVTREKRQISNALLNSWEPPKGFSSGGGHHLGKGVKVRRRDFPDGGYLIVDHKYAKILSQRSFKPKYHVLDWHSKKFLDIDYRNKRANIDAVSVTYCCTHKCSPLEMCLATGK